MNYRGFVDSIRLLCLSIIFLGIAGLSTANTLPTHRYSFDGNANDSIGTAHGTLLGNAIIANGRLVLDGTNSRVQLPGNMFTNSKSLSFEVWFRNDQHVVSQGLWSFPGTPNLYFMFRESAGTPLFSRFYYGSLTVNAMLPMAPISTGREHHLVWSQDQATKLARVYLNGELYAENTNFTATPGPTSTGFLGSQGMGNPVRGWIAEFRTYSNALTHLEVVRSRAAGPDVLLNSLGGVTNLQLQLAPHLGLQALVRPTVRADFADCSGVDVTPLPGVTVVSSDTNVIAPASGGYLRAVGLGTAELTAIYEGLSNTMTLNVVASEPFALAHRYNFKQSAGTSNVMDLAGGNAPGLFIGGGAFTNGSQLYLNGFNGYVDLPDGLISRLETVTIEAWVTRYQTSVFDFWARIFDFGSRQTNGVGLNYIFLSSVIVETQPPGIVRFAANEGAGETLQLSVPPWQRAGVESHYAVVYDPPSNLSKLYTNGTLAAVGFAPVPLNHLTDTNNWLGRSQFSGDSLFHGMFNEFRIYRTALSDAAIAASYELGPDIIGADFVLRPQLSDTNLVISWGPAAGWCRLESSVPAESTAAWTNANATVIFTNGSYQTTVPLTDQVRFFRLAAP